MNVYALLSEVYSKVEPVLDYGQGPSEDARDACFFLAETRAKANYMYQKKYCHCTNVRDFIKVQIKKVGNIDLPVGEISIKEAEKNGIFFPYFEE